MRKYIFIFIASNLINIGAYASEVITQNLANGCDASVIYPTNGHSNIYALFEKDANMSYLITQNTTNGCDDAVIYSTNGHSNIHALFDKDPNINDWFLNATSIAKGCDVKYIHPTSNRSVMRAYYQPTAVTCSEGYYLPAGATTCAACPDGFTCDGGTLEYNDKFASGIKYPQPILNNVSGGCNYRLVNRFDKPQTKMYAVFQRNLYSCDVGYYLPANTDGCVICPIDSFCVGGLYFFDETETQGIEACPENFYAPMGMWEDAQCGRRMHVGEDILYLRRTKQTTPSINVKIGNDMFYGNMTTSDTIMNIDTTHKLKLRYGGTTYSIHDDTVNVGD